MRPNTDLATTPDTRSPAPERQSSVSGPLHPALLELARLLARQAAAEVMQATAEIVQSEPKDSDPNDELNPANSTSADRPAGGADPANCPASAPMGPIELIA